MFLTIREIRRRKSALSKTKTNEIRQGREFLLERIQNCLNLHFARFGWK